LALLTLHHRRCAHAYLQAALCCTMLLQMDTMIASPGC
jgi:hypothetical protein